MPKRVRYVRHKPVAFIRKAIKLWKFFERAFCFIVRVCPAPASNNSPPPPHSSCYGHVTPYLDMCMSHVVHAEANTQLVISSDAVPFPRDIKDRLDPNTFQGVVDAARVGLVLPRITAQHALDSFRLMNEYDVHNLEPGVDCSPIAPCKSHVGERLLAWRGRGVCH